MKPTKGRIVFFHAADGEPLAAIIVKVWNDTCVNLAVIDESGTLSARTSVVQGDEPGKWNWPPRV